APTPTGIDAARGNPDLLILNAGVFDPAAEAIAARSVGAAADIAASAYAIVQFRDSADFTAARSALVKQGVEFLAYVPNNAWYVRLGHDGLRSAQRHADVRWAGLLQPALKVA